MNRQSPKEAWQATVNASPLPSLEDVRAGADRFYRVTRQRNRIEYAASALVVACFTAYAFLLPPLTARVGSVMVVLGTLFVAWQLRRLASAEPPPEAVGISPILIHQRAQFVRQHAALKRVFRWYLLPLLPGLLTMIVGPVVEWGLREGFGWIHLLAVAAPLAVVASVFGGVWWLNQLAARKLDKAIREIDALTGECE
jgi:hypothetical protein